VCVPIFSCFVFAAFIEELFPLCMPGGQAPFKTLTFVCASAN
jgi:hypothetical protein